MQAYTTPKKSQSPITYWEFPLSRWQDWKPYVLHWWWEKRLMCRRQTLWGYGPADHDCQRRREAILRKVKASG